MPSKLAIKYLALALLAPSAMGWYFFARERPSIQESSLSSQGQEFSSLTLDTISFTPQAGKRYRFAFRRDLQFMGLGSESSSISFRGHLDLDILNVDSSGFSAIARESIEGQAPTRVAIKFSLDRSGRDLRLLTSFVQTEEEAQHLDALKDLLSNLFFHLEADTFGPYRAKMENLPSQPGFLARKKIKVSYITNGPAPHIRSSLHFLKWDSQLGMPKEVKGADKAEIGGGEASLITKNAYEIQFESATKSPKISKEEIARINQPSTITLDPRSSPEGSPLHSDLNWQSLSKTLAEIHSLSQGEQLAAFGDLIRLVGKDPSTIAKLLALLRSENSLKKGDALFRTTVGALSTVGSPEALAALRTIYIDPDTSVPGKGTILAALTTTEATIDLDTRSFLSQIMKEENNRDLAQGAAFALGSALQKATNDSQSRDAINDILALWNREKSHGSLGEKLALLDTMGNSGRIEFFPALSEVINSASDSQLRAKAVFSLRFMDSQLPQEMLAKAVRDTELQVRSGAVMAISLAPWREAFRRPLGECSKSESVPDIMKACQGVLESKAVQTAQR